MMMILVMRRPDLQADTMGPAIAMHCNRFCDKNKCEVCSHRKEIQTIFSFHFKPKLCYPQTENQSAGLKEVQYTIVDEFCELIYLGSTTDVCARWSQTRKIIPKLVSTNISRTNAQVTTEKLVLQSLQLNLKGTVSSKFRSKGLAFDGCISCGALLRTSHQLGQHTNFSFKRDLNFSRFTKQCLVCVICD